MEIKKYFEVLERVLSDIDTASIDSFVNKIIESYKKDKFLFVIGNGGSAASASHFAQDLAKGVFINNQGERKRIKALSLVDNVPYMTALANDDGYENIFSGQLINFASMGDVLIVISGSGNSKNIIKAVDFARENGIEVIGITGYDGGYLKEHSDISVHVPLAEMCSVESVHSIIFHYVISKLKSILYKDKKDFDALQKY